MTHQSIRARLLNAHPLNGKHQIDVTKGAFVYIPKDGYWSCDLQEPVTREQLLDAELVHRTTNDRSFESRRYMVTPDTYIAFSVDGVEMVYETPMYYLTAFMKKDKTRYVDGSLAYTEEPSMYCVASEQTRNVFDAMVWIDVWSKRLRDDER